MVSRWPLRRWTTPLNNRNGEISSLGSLTANIGQFDNREKGRLLANGALLLTA
ncbi:filamentous hemagglutinin, intein-containing, partial [Pseudomonas syringae pv. actinidiae ICMP 19079]